MTRQDRLQTQWRLLGQGHVDGVRRTGGDHQQKKPDAERTDGDLATRTRQMEKPAQQRPRPVGTQEEVLQDERRRRQVGRQQQAEQEAEEEMHRQLGPHALAEEAGEAREKEEMMQRVGQELRLGEEEAEEQEDQRRTEEERHRQQGAHALAQEATEARAKEELMQRVGQELRLGLGEEEAQQREDQQLQQLGEEGAQQREDQRLQQLAGVGIARVRVAPCRQPSSEGTAGRNGCSDTSRKRRESLEAEATHSTCSLGGRAPALRESRQGGQLDGQHNRFGWCEQLCPRDAEPSSGRSGRHGQGEPDHPTNTRLHHEEPGHECA